ncbi:MAG TPA: hypothetical protein VLB69_14565 [Rudaea sp.]|nr:hypothetical protein [Rudaea sp.]
MTSDPDEDTLRELALPPGPVDVKVCAVSEVRSGLKFLRAQGSQFARAVVIEQETGKSA